MPTLNIEGVKVKVGDEFLKLSSDQQNDAVDEIASSLRASGKIKAPDQLRLTANAPQYDAMGNPTGASETVEMQQAPPSRTRDQIDDVVKGFGGGVVRGTAGLLGTPEMLAGLLTKGGERAAQYLTGESDADFDRRMAERKANRMLPGVGDALSSEAIQHGIEKVTGPAYQPQTIPGKFASTVGEFIPGAMAGSPASMARNVTAFGIVPGIASEAAGQATKDSWLETPARVAGAMAGGLGAMGVQRAGSAERIVQNAGRGVTSAELDAAEALVQDARREGVNLSRAEALQHVTEGRTQLGDLQRRVEGLGGMRDFHAERPAQNEAFARRTFDGVAPPNAAPSQIGPTAGVTAEGLVQDVRGAINRATRPMYDAAGQNLVPRNVHQAMMADPLFAETVDTIRRDPARNATVRAASDRSVAMYDAVAKELEQRSRNTAQPLNPQANQTVSAVTGNLGGDVKDIAVAADRAAANGPSSYEAALATQTRLREQYLNPLLNGPIGKLAGRDRTTKEAVEALFPANPLPNSADEVGRSVTALANRNPRVARDLVRAHAEMTFNEATQRLATSGPNQGGGAKFAAALRGNPQQAENLEAAVRALPNGDAIWPGFNRMLDIMEAQQRRVPIGSATAFNAEGMKALRNGGAANAVAETVSTGGLKLPARIKEAIENWNLGRNLDQVATLLTSPESAQRFRQLLEAPPTSARAAGLIARLGYLGLQGYRTDHGPVRITVRPSDK